MTFDEYVNFFRRLDISVLSTRRSLAEWHIDLNELSTSSAVLAGCAGGGAITSGRVRSNGVCVLWPDERTSILVNGVTAGNGDIAVLTPGASFVLVNAEPTEFVAILFRREWRAGPWLSSSPSEGPFIVRSEQWSRAGVTHRLLKSVGNAREREVTGLLEQISQLPRVATDTPRLRLLIEILSEIERRAPYARITELARDARVSDRTLLRMFRQFLGLTPKQYLLLYQLHFIRRRIIDMRPANKVTELLLSCGVNEFGRVAGYYRRLFDEKPSDTLRRFQQSQRRATLLPT